MLLAYVRKTDMNARMKNPLPPPPLRNNVKIVRSECFVNFNISSLGGAGGGGGMLKEHNIFENALNSAIAWLPCAY